MEAFLCDFFQGNPRKRKCKRSNFRNDSFSKAGNENAVSLQANSTRANTLAGQPTSYSSSGATHQLQQTGQPLVQPPIPRPPQPLTQSQLHVLPQHSKHQVYMYSYRSYHSSKLKQTRQTRATTLFNFRQLHILMNFRGSLMKIFI